MSSSTHFPRCLCIHREDTFQLGACVVVILQTLCWEVTGWSEVCWSINNGLHLWKGQVVRAPIHIIVCMFHWEISAKQFVFEQSVISQRNGCINVQTNPDFDSMSQKTDHASFAESKMTYFPDVEAPFLAKSLEVLGCLILSHRPPVWVSGQVQLNRALWGSQISWHTPPLTQGLSKQHLFVQPCFFSTPTYKTWSIVYIIRLS